MKYSNLFARVVFLATFNLPALFCNEINPSICGKSLKIRTQNDIATFIAEDNVAQLGDFPWHAAIFRKNENSEDLICGATIISSKYLITSSRCFLNENIHVGNYRIAVGIIDWRDNQTNEEAKFYNLAEITMYPSENDIDSGLQTKIAILKTSEDISFDQNVVPICLRSSNDIAQTTDVLYTAGWTADGSGETVSYEMRSVRLPYFTYAYCRDNAPSNLSNSIKSNTLCSIKARDPSIDHGDLGGGLVLRKPDNKFYLVGVLEDFVKAPKFNILYSTVKNSPCMFTLCRSTPDRDDGIENSTELTTKSTPNRDDGIEHHSKLPTKWCDLPQNTSDKSYSVSCSANCNLDLEKVPEMTLLSFQCNPDYGDVNGRKYWNLTCLNNTWVPDILSCTRYCPRLNTTNIRCTLNNKSIKCDDKFLPNTKLDISCQAGHQPNHRQIICDENGIWDIVDVKCVPSGQDSDCGRYDERKETGLPWNVNVRIFQKNYTGTLLSSNLILTFIPEISSSSDNNVPAIVQTSDSKVYRVNQIFRASEFFKNNSQSKIRNLYRNFAVLHLKDNLAINDEVQPVCFDWNNKILPHLKNSPNKAIVQLRNLGKKYVVASIPFQRDTMQSSFSAIVTGGDIDVGSGCFVKNPQNGRYYISDVSSNRWSCPNKIRIMFLKVFHLADWLNDTSQKIAN